MDICTAMYHRVSDDVFETFLRTFRKVSGAHLQVYTDNVPLGLQKKWSNDYQVVWVNIESMKGKRCYVKMQAVRSALSKCKDGDRIIVSDVDTYYLADPFLAFSKLDYQQNLAHDNHGTCNFDIGVTLRLHSYKFPVNSGVFFINVNKKSRESFDYFDVYAEDHKNSWDWFVDQDFINFLYECGEAVDVGWEYNFCPNTDYFGVDKAADMIKRAYESKSVKVLHLKSELKMCIYEGFLEDAVTKHLKGGWDWRKEGA